MEHTGKLRKLWLSQLDNVLLFLKKLSLPTFLKDMKNGFWNNANPIEQKLNQRDGGDFFLLLFAYLISAWSFWKVLKISSLKNSFKCVERTGFLLLWEPCSGLFYVHPLNSHHSLAVYPHLAGEETEA